MARRKAAGISERIMSQDLWTSTDEVRRRLGLTDKTAQEVDFDAKEVPEKLRDLVPLARVLGVGDDIIRDEIVAAANPQALRQVKQQVSSLDNELEAWLTSPEATRRGPTKAHVAFTNLRLIAS
jgi:hypothetical protein